MSRVRDLRGLVVPVLFLAVLATLVVLVSIARGAPTASFTFDPTSPEPGEVVTFTSNSTSPGATIVSYAWDLDGDGAYGEPGEPEGTTATTAQRSFPAAGAYEVGLRVVDSTGAPSTSRRTVQVGAPATPGESLPPVRLTLLSPSEEATHQSRTATIFGRVQTTTPLLGVTGILVAPGGESSQPLRLDHYCTDCLRSGSEADLKGRGSAFVTGATYIFGPLQVRTETPGPYRLDVTARTAAGTEQRSVGWVFQTPPPIFQQNLFITGAELTQGIQLDGSLVTRSDERATSRLPTFTYRGVPMIQDRRTVLRIWAGGRDLPSGSLGGVPALLRAFRPDGTELPSSPIQASPSTITVQAGGVEQVDIQRKGPQTRTLTYGGESGTWNFQLPSAWTYVDGLRLRAQINTAQIVSITPQLGECAGCNDFANEIDLRVPNFYSSTQGHLRIYPWRPIYRLSLPLPGTPPPNTSLAWWQDQPGQLLDSARKLFPIATNGIIVKSLQGSYFAGTGYLQGEAEWAKDELPFDTDYPEVTFGMLPLIPLDRPGSNIGDISVAQVGSVQYDDNPPGWTLPGDLDDPNVTNPSDPLVTASSLNYSPAHEIAHALGFPHASNAHGECDGGSCDDDFPNDHGGIGGYGFDIERNLAIRPSCCFDGALFPDVVYHRHDFMSYGHAQYARSRWISVTNYNALFLTLGGSAGQLAASLAGVGRRNPSVPVSRLVRAAVEAAPESPRKAGRQALRFGITGGIDAAGGARLGRLAEEMTGPDRMSKAGDYSIVMRGAGDAVLHTRRFEPVRVEDGDGSLSFALTLPRLTATRKIELRNAGQVLASRVRSARPPSVRLLSERRRLPRGAAVKLRWRSADPDGDRLTFEIEFSRNDGRTWRTVAGGIRRRAYSLDLGLLQGTAHGRFRIVANDGFFTRRDESDRSFVVPNRPPEPYVYAPERGTNFIAGTAPLLSGFAFDPEQGRIPPASLRWRSSRDGPFGRGPAPSFRSPSIGKHVISLIAKDRAGRTSTARTTIVVGRGITLFPGIGGSVDRSRPSGRVVSPKSGALGGRPRLVLRFSEPVTGVNGQTLRLTGRSGPISSRILHSSGDRKAVLIPRRRIGRLQTLRLRGAGITDLQGNVMRPLRRSLHS